MLPDYKQFGRDAGISLLTNFAALQGEGMTALGSGAFNILLGPLAPGAHAIECSYGNGPLSCSGVSEVRGIAAAENHSSRVCASDHTPSAFG